MIGCDQTPQEHEYFLMERNLSAAVWKQCVLTINEVLEVLDETCVQWVEVDFAMHHAQQSIVFIYCQVLQDLLGDCLLVLLTLLLRA